MNINYFFLIISGPLLLEFSRLVFGVFIWKNTLLPDWSQDSMQYIEVFLIFFWFCWFFLSFTFSDIISFYFLFLLSFIFIYSLCLIESVIKSLLSFIVKTPIIEKSKTATNLKNIDLSSEDNLLPIKEVEIGLG